MESIKINGYNHPDFQQVSDGFRDNFTHRDELGASICVYHKGEIVVNHWAGYKDLDKNIEWTEDTVVPMFSTSKLVASSCLAVCHSRGYFDYKDKVSKYWPEFAQNDKEDITIEELLNHRAGLAVIDTPLNFNLLNNYKELDKVLAQQKPSWTPGDYQGYHSWTIGFYISALLCRIDPLKRRVKQFVKEEFVSVIDGDLRIGIDNHYDFTKIATLDPFSKLRGMSRMKFKFVRQFFMPWTVTFKSMLNPRFVSNHANFNLKEVLELDFGAGGGIGNARGLVSLLENLFFDDYSKIHLSNETKELLAHYPKAPRKALEDIILKEEGFTFSLGYMKPNKQHNFSENQTALGGFGAGGSFAFIDADKDLIVAYTMNKMGEDMMNGERELAIRNAVYASIEAIRN